MIPGTRRQAYANPTPMLRKKRATTAAKNDDVRNRVAVVAVRVFVLRSGIHHGVCGRVR
jgi:hypothetical protein